MLKVAIVILNWNGKDLLKQFLPSVVQYSDPSLSKVYIIDNYSTDDSLSFLHSTYPEIEIISLDKNYGFAEGYNLGLKKIESEFYILLNSDVEVTENWLSPLIYTLENNEDVAIVQPKLLSERNRVYFEYAGASGGYIDKLGFPFCRGRIFDTLEQDNLQYESSKQIFWASGACFAIKKSIFDDHNGFDSYFFAHMEEIDLCWRIGNSGYKIMCIPQSVVYHVGGATLKDTSPYKTYLNYRNNMLMIYKNIADSDLKSTIKKRRFYNYIAALKSLISGNLSIYKAIIKADKDFQQSKKLYARDESKKTLNIFKNSTVVYQKNLIISYYFLRKKKFDNLDF